MTKKILTTICAVVLMVLFTTINVVAAPSVSLSGPRSVTVGDSVTITISNDSSGKYSLTGTVTVSGASSGSLVVALNAAGSNTVNVNASKTGTINVSFKGEYALNEAPFTPGSVTKSLTITVKEKPSTGGGNTGGSDNTGGGNTGTYNPEMPKGETEAEKKARELAERQKKPLIENISIISESTRLKGETLLEDNPSVSKFDYAFELPRGVDAFKLDLVPIADDVVLEYTQMYKLDAGHDKVEIVVRASQDEVEQEFKITVKKAPESKAVYTVGQGSYRFLNDELLDKVISKYGFEVVYFDEDVDKTDYYYQYGENKLVLVYGDNGEGKWLLIDGNRNVLNEVLIVVDGEDKVTLLIDKVLEEDDKRTYGGRRYGPIVVLVDNDFYNLDYGLNFATDIKGWEHDLDSYFTHAIDLNGDEKLVYLDKQGHTEVAYVAFDNQGVSLDGMVMPVIAGVSGISSIGLLIYSRKQSRKISKLLRRRSQD